VVGEAYGVVEWRAVGVDGVLEDEALVVTLAVPLRLFAVVAEGPVLIAFDASFPTGFEAIRKTVG
jgi:hypothetical protein